MPRLRWVLALALCAALTTLSAADDPFNGAWRLNTAKSKYDPGPGPDKATVTIQSDGVTTTVKTESSYEGKSFATSYSARLDGTPAPLQGSPVADTVSIKKTGERTRELKSLKGDKVVSEAGATLSDDGKTITVVGSGLNPKGQKTTFTAVYEKQ